MRIQKGTIRVQTHDWFLFIPQEVFVVFFVVVAVVGVLVVGVVTVGVAGYVICEPEPCPVPYPDPYCSWSLPAFEENDMSEDVSEEDASKSRWVLRLLSLSTSENAENAEPEEGCALELT